MKRLLMAAALLGAIAAGPMPAVSATASGERIKITGEVIDTWCYVTEIMYAQGTAHRRCAVWCAIGGIPVSILAEDGTVYVVLKVEGDADLVADERIVRFQTHEVVVEGDHYVRDGVNYLIVTSVADDNGIVNINHEEFGIQP